jgi:transposase
MAYRIAGVDVHKRMLAVVIADAEIDGEYQFERRKVGTSPDQLRSLAEWLVTREVEEVVMESTAQYWRPVWHALEQHWIPHRRQSQPSFERQLMRKRSDFLGIWRAQQDSNLRPPGS